MTISYADIDQLLIIIDADDPITYDAEFTQLLTYGGFAKEFPDFTDENREIARKRSRGNILDGKFVIEIYADKLDDFVYRTMPTPNTYRALIFRAVNVLYAPEMEPDESDSEGLTEHHFIYELRTVGTSNSVVVLTDDEDDEDEPDEGADSDPEPIAAPVEELDAMDMQSSVFYRTTKVLH